MIVPAGVAASAGWVAMATQPAPAAANTRTRERSTALAPVALRYLTVTAYAICPEQPFVLRQPPEPAGCSWNAAPPTWAVNFVAPAGPGPGVYVNSVPPVVSVAAAFRPFVNVAQLLGASVPSSLMVN